VIRGLVRGHRVQLLGLQSNLFKIDGKTLDVKTWDQAIGLTGRKPRVYHIWPRGRAGYSIISLSRDKPSMRVTLTQPGDKAV